MALVLRELYKYSIYYMTEARDTRIEDYFLMGPIQFAVVLSLYIYFVKSLGPKIMEHRKPFELKTTMIIYNAIQVILSLWVGCYGCYIFLNAETNWLCMVTDFSRSEKGMKEAQISYYYYILKVFDLMDTIFFVVRKRQKQITFLHFYHHVGILSGSYIIVNYLPGGHGLLLGLINCFVHAVMYFYYMLTCLSSDLKSSIWWKKHITHIQLIQFTVLIVHFGHPLLFGNCTYPVFWLFMGFIQNLFMLLLFSDFYYKAYVKKTQKKGAPIKN